MPAAAIVAVTSVVIPPFARVSFKLAPAAMLLKFLDGLVKAAQNITTGGYSHQDERDSNNNKCKSLHG